MQSIWWQHNSFTQNPHDEICKKNNISPAEKQILDFWKCEIWLDLNSLTQPKCPKITNKT